MEVNDSQYEKKWDTILQILKGMISSQIYNSWFSQIEYIDFKDNELFLAVPDSFSKNWLEKNYCQLIKEVVTSQLNLEGDFLINFNISKAPHQKNVSRVKKDSTKDIAQKRYEDTGLNNNYTFENFVAGTYDRFADAASRVIAQLPGKQYNPLVIYGNRNVNPTKLHLIHAIGNYVFEKYPKFKIVCIPAERFPNEFTSAINEDKRKISREKYRNLDFLIISNIQFFAGKKKIQEEFIHTFDTLYKANKQIVVTSDRLPKEIPNLGRRIVFRLGLGLHADIYEPGFEAKVDILNEKAKDLQLKLPVEIIEYIANKIPYNIPYLERALIKLKNYIDLAAKNGGIHALVDWVIRDSIPIVKEEEISIQLIQKKTAEFFNIEPNILFSEDIELARQIALYLTKELTGYSFHMIGDTFEGNDSTTALTSYHKIKRQLKADKILKLNIERLTSNIKNSVIQ